jgi:hypothetical protein
MMNDCVEPERAPGRFAGHRLVQPLHEDASWTTGHGAAKSANRDAQLNRATVRWQVEEPPFIAAVHPPGSFAAIGTFARRGAASSDDEDAVPLDHNIVD